MYRIFFLGIIFGALLTFPAFAQLDQGALAPDITISATPQNPQPLEPVVLEITSYSADLNQATVSWRYNGKVISSGIGKTQISTLAPAANASAIITATVTGAGLTSSTAALTLRTADVDLLWEAADSYTPAFYKGKAMLSTNGVVRVTAIPSRSAPKNLSFEWSRNDSVVEDSSGYNKNSIIFKNETLKQRESISVTASNGAFSGTNSLSLSPASPQIVLYPKDGGFIDYAHGSLGTFTTKTPGITVRFEPYFFSTPHSLTSDLNFDIKNNDTDLYGDSRPNEIALSRPDSGSESDIEVSIHTALYSLQNALRKFTIIFN